MGLKDTYMTYVFSMSNIFYILGNYVAVYLFDNFSFKIVFHFDKVLNAINIILILVCVFWFSPLYYLLIFPLRMAISIIYILIDLMCFKFYESFQSI